MTVTIKYKYVESYFLFKIFEIDANFICILGSFITLGAASNCKCLRMPMYVLIKGKKLRNF
jgi:hypothetical protein